MVLVKIVTNFILATEGACSLKYTTDVYPCFIRNIIKYLFFVTVDISKEVSCMV